MKLKVSVTGQTPAFWREALAELSDDLNMKFADGGVPVRGLRRQFRGPDLEQ